MDVITQSFDFQVADTSHKAYLAFDEQAATGRPGVLVLHEWWGMNDTIHRRVHRLAELGYAAMSIDLFGDGRIAADVDEASTLMNAALANMEKTSAILQQGYELLIGQNMVDKHRCAVIGYCFGGAMALHSARLGMPLSAVVSFHGALGSTREIGVDDVKARILVCHGEADSMVTMQDLDAFRQEMDGAGVSYEVITYPGAKHGFTNPEADNNAARYGIDVGYQQAADEQSWQAMRDFFGRVL